MSGCLFLKQLLQNFAFEKNNTYDKENLQPGINKSLLHRGGEVCGVAYRMCHDARHAYLSRTFLKGE